jgi:hypothetical protein
VDVGRLSQFQAPIGADRVLRSRALILGQNRSSARPRRRLALEQWHERAPVHGPASGPDGARLRAREVEDRRGDVDVCHLGGDLGVPSGAQVGMRNPDQERLAEILLVGDDLAARDAMLAVEDPLSEM